VAAAALKELARMRFEALGSLGRLLLAGGHGLERDEGRGAAALQEASDAALAEGNPGRAMQLGEELAALVG
jgi:hypothetical protein